MFLVADMHAHFYPDYDVGAALSAAFRNLDRIAATSEIGAAENRVLALCLAERNDCRFFAAMIEGRHNKVTDGWNAGAAANGTALLFNRGGDSLYVFPGRQVATKEGLEVLALAADTDIPDGSTAPETVETVLAGGGIPVLPWSPGKWFFGRGRIVRQLLRDFSPSELVLGDTALRPVGWPEPALLRDAAKLGFKVAAGSDPLPFPGEETRMGSYAAAADVAFDEANPFQAVRNMLMRPEIEIERQGSRGNPLLLPYRLWRNRMSKCRPSRAEQPLMENRE